MKPQPEHITRARTAHLKALETLRAPTCKLSGLQLWRKLCRLERIAHAAATAQCNGAPYGGQPFRLYCDPATGEESDNSEWDKFTDEVRAKVAAIFGKMPDGFCYNQDPRGYSLKLDPVRAPVPAGIWRDFGGYGILAAIID